MNTNTEYTNLWIENFGVEEALKYDRKFYKQFEKNIKHRQQLKIIKKYLKLDTNWLDAPVGSGRIMNDILHNRDKCFIFDYSKPFLDFSQKRLGINASNIYQGDIFNISLDRKFDLITCNNMLFAFNNFDLILVKLVQHLTENGVLICDIVNKDMYKNLDFNANEALKRSYEGEEKNIGWDEKNIIEFCVSNDLELLEIIPHDYYDNEYILNWRIKGNTFIRRFKSYLFVLANKLYFKFHLFNLFDLIEDKEEIKLFNKLIIVVRKKSV